jgi:hypothetical protein
MALAVWDITTITSPTTLYGVAAVRWVTFPDAYPVIGYMMTTTPVKGTSAYGLYIELVASTSPMISSGAGVATVAPVQVPWKVRSYQKGTRSFIIDCDQVTMQTGSGALESGTLNGVLGVNRLKRLILYYRAMDEVGEVPA